MNARTADGQGPCSVCSYRKCLRLQMPMPMRQVFKRWLPRWESLISTSGCLSMMMCVRNFSGISRQFDHGVVICSFMFVQFVSWFCISSTRMLHNFHLCRMWDLAWGGPQPKPLTFTLELDNSSLSWCKPKWRRNLATRSLECWTPFQNVWKRFPRTGRCHKMSQISQGFTRCLKMSRISAALNCFHVRDREGFFFPEVQMTTWTQWFRTYGQPRVLTAPQELKLKEAKFGLTMALPLVNFSAVWTLSQRHPLLRDFQVLLRLPCNTTPWSHRNTKDKNHQTFGENMWTQLKNVEKHRPILQLSRVSNNKVLLGLLRTTDWCRPVGRSRILGLGLC